MSFTDRLNAGTTDRSWPWVASGGLTYQSASTWTTAFAATRYLKLTAPTYVPSGATVSGASFVHRYRRVTSGIVCWYMEVLQGTTVIGTHGSAADPDLVHRQQQQLRHGHGLAAGDQHARARQRGGAEALPAQLDVAAQRARPGHS